MLGIQVSLYFIINLLLTITIFPDIVYYYTKNVFVFCYYMFVSYKDQSHNNSIIEHLTLTFYILWKSKKNNLTVI
jgi:hypothetical protein